LKKTIILIGGTGRSGSTLLDLILGNDPKAMSLGEIRGLFIPRRKHHFEEIKRLKKDKIWNEILLGGQERLYENLILFYPDIDIFIDSSKDPFWIEYQNKVVPTNYEIKNVLIYKAPIELAKSFIKRGQKTEWLRTFKHYHKIYFSLINNFSTISYKNLVASNTVLEKLCNFCNLKYSERKKDYWENKDDIIFGSNSVRKENSENVREENNKQERKTLKYDGVVSTELKDFVKEILENDTSISSIQIDLDNHHIGKIKTKNLVNKYSSILLKIILIKHLIKNKIQYYFPENLYNK
jgi:hypothetical protein